MVRDRNPAYQLSGQDVPRPVHELALILIAADIGTRQSFREQHVSPVVLRELSFEWISRKEGFIQRQTVDDGYRAAWQLYRALPALGWKHDGKTRDVGACIAAGME